MEGRDLYEWQQDILDIISGEVDDRKIYWYWEAEGNAGKTSLAKHICLTDEQAIYVCGSANHIKYAVANCKEPPRIVLWDIPRNGKVDYGAVEQIKNGIFFSTKYESDMYLFDPPHIICFSNREPVMHAVSLDRWNIVEIGASAAAASGEAAAAAPLAAEPLGPPAE